MRRARIAALALAVLLAAGTAAWAKFKPLLLADQYAKAGHVLRARFDRGHAVPIAEHIEYTLWEFEVVEQFKGEVRPLNAPDRPNRIVVVGQTQHNWDCPSPPAFQPQGEYFLFLQATGSQYLYGVVTDWQGDLPATPATLAEIRALKQ